ncbi:MAG: beta-ketoacyl-ACP synthase [Pseudomonadales bacterium]
MSKDAIYLHSVGVVCPLGSGVEAVSEALFSDMPPGGYFRNSEKYSPGRSLPLGLVRDPLAAVEIAHEATRNNSLLTTAVQPLLKQIEDYKTRYGAHRVAAIIGTSTSGISDGEIAIQHFVKEGTLPKDYLYSMQEVSSPARYLANYLGVSGPSWAVSSACTSGGKALVSAARLLRLGVCDMVVAGGVDTLCEMTVAGFSALGVTASSPCKPFSKHRQGINIGEAAAVFIMSREAGAIRLQGSGETSDAYHISAPHPEGTGAEAAMRAALNAGGLAVEQVDYLNFHGTATAQNDKMEAFAVHRVFGEHIACGSTKSLTGHTLGAAGALEAVFCWMCLQRDDGRLPTHAWDGHVDPELPSLPGLASVTLQQRAKVAMSNSFAFGGNNLSLLLARD